MARKFKFCLHCRRTITESMVARGEFVRTKYGMICTSCAEQLDAAQQEEAQESAQTAPLPAPAPLSLAAEALQTQPQMKPAPVPEPLIVAPPPAPPAQMKPEQEQVILMPPPPEPESLPASKIEVVLPPEPPRIVEAPEPDTQDREQTAPEPEPAPPAPTLESSDAQDNLLALRRQVEAIQRLLLFEKTSSWNVAATVTQCLAAGVFLIAIFNWTENPLNLLLVALILQVMALTFYVKGK